MFTANKKKIIDFCKDLINMKLKITWSCSARIDCLDSELLYYMSKSGCTDIFLGIETGSQRMQDIIKKRLKIDVIYDRISELGKFGIKPTISFIYGFYDETEEDLRCTINMIMKFIRSGIHDVQLHKLMIMPGTEEYIKLKDKLFISYENINMNIFEGRYLRDVLPIIESSKDIFANFYDFETEVRNNYMELETYILLINCVYSFYRNTINIIFDYYDGDYLKLYKDNEEEIKKIKKCIYERQSEFIEDQNDIIQAILLEGFCKIIERFLMEAWEYKNINYVYKLENDIKIFMMESNDKKIIEYDVDIISYIKNMQGNKDENLVFEKNMLLFEKLSENQVKIKRYK